jgi:hypothetical protein
MSEKSDKWLEGDRGQAYSTWKEYFENADLEESSLEEPDQIEVPDEPSELSVDLEDAVEVLEQLPEEMEG